MQEIIHKLDDWSIIKVLGGTAVIIIAVLGFFSKYLLGRLEQGGKYGYDKKLEEIKGAINKGNGTLNNAIQSYLSSSQKLLDKKIQAYDLLWSCIIDIRSKFPAGIVLVYQLFPDSWFEDIDAFHKLNSNPRMGTVLQAYDRDEEMKSFVDNGKALMPYKPYISDKSYKLFYTYQGLIGRVTHQFIWDYERSKVFDWKKDKPLDDILKVSLSEKELVYIKSLKIGSLNALIDLLEYKILQDLRETLGIKANTGDTISYLKDIEQILTAKNK